MAWRFHGHAEVNPDHPEAFGVCDRCGRWWNHNRLHWQHDWRGSKLANIRILVCDDCTDLPFELRRPLKLPPDPEPIKDARPENFYVDGEGAGGSIS